MRKIIFTSKLLFIQVEELCSFIHR
jgi:hypothetical protein